MRWLPVLICLISLSANCATFSHSELQEWIEAKLRSMIQVPVGTSLDIKVRPIDKRVKIQSCDIGAIELLTPQKPIYRNKSVGIRCQKPRIWTLYNPVDIQIQGKIVTAARPISRGQIVEQKDLRISMVDLSSQQSVYFKQVEDVVGMIARRSIQMNLPITQIHIEAPIVIQKGQKIQIIANISQVNVAMEGIALSNGKQGERIKVKNISSERIIEGIVKNNHTIVVGI